MCAYGITCLGVLRSYADYDPTAFKRHAARFSSPAYPGETVTLELWRDGDVISFQPKVKARGATVVKNPPGIQVDPNTLSWLQLRFVVAPLTSARRHQASTGAPFSTLEPDSPHHTR